jgi:hypothetical protein
VGTTHPAEQDITLVIRADNGRDSDGNQILAGTQVTVRGLFAPGSSSELIQGQDTAIAHPSVILFPPLPTISARDGVIVNGTPYEVDGQPEQWQPGTVVRLMNVTG